ncbi:unnamed protein product [Protopolystoma xenopodis]|uniref:Uncharacterized protein n=1 Tax=Protopolystoma xenopodis TaxID=117903 RepID=A0A448XM69_9PLAT|nr:unnamed protein product [Protopolystoma xenopodis]
MMCQVDMLNCHGSTPGGGVDKTDARSKLQSTGAWMRTTFGKARRRLSSFEKAGRRDSWVGLTGYRRRVILDFCPLNCAQKTSAHRHTTPMTACGTFFRFVTDYS